MTRHRTPAITRRLCRALPAALVLVLAAPPLPLAAQQAPDTPVIAQRATKGETDAITAMAPIPDGWIAQSYFGLDFALPSNFELIDSDVTAGDGIYATLGYHDEAAQRRDLAMILFAPPGDAEIMLDDFDDTNASGERPWTEVQVGGMMFRQYRVIGTPNPERPDVIVRTRLLVGSEPNALGWVPSIMLAHSGEPPLAAEDALDEAVMASLRRNDDPSRYGVADPSLLQPAQSVPSVGKPDPAGAAQSDTPAAPPPPVSAETDYWLDAREADDIAGVLSYMERWPQGVHADEARAWLHARAIVAPGDVPESGMMPAPATPAPATPDPAPAAPAPTKRLLAR